MSSSHSVYIMADRSHDQLLRLCIEASSAMPRLPRAHCIPHMPLLAANTIIDQLIPAYPVNGAPVHRIELAMLKIMRASLFHLLSMQINAARSAPYDFQLKLSTDDRNDIIPAILSSTVCKATQIRPDTMREVLWHYLGAAPINLRFRARCDPGTDDGVLRIPPAAFVQLDLLDAQDRVSQTKRFFSAGLEEENWSFEQWEMAKGLKEPHIDVWEMMPDSLLDKLNTPVDEDLSLAESAEPLSLNTSWPPRPHWSTVLAKPTFDPTNGRASPVAPLLSRCATSMTDSTLATPSAFGISPLASPFASPFVQRGKAELYPSPMLEQKKSAIKAGRGSMIRHMRSTAVPIQRYEGGNVYVRGSGLYLGLPENMPDCVDYYWALEDDVEYTETDCEADDKTVSAWQEDEIEDSPGWVRARQASRPPRLAGQDVNNTARLGSLKNHFQATQSFLPTNETVETIETRPVSELLYPLSIPESRCVSPISSVDCPSATTATTAATDPSSRFSPCSSTSSLASAGKKRRGKRGGKQLRERKERAMAERMASGAWTCFEDDRSLIASASDRTIIAH